MRINIIAAVDSNGLIAVDGQIPWHKNAAFDEIKKLDLKRFREKTMGKPILMGRKTFESLGGPLNLRENIVISKSMAGREVDPDGNLRFFSSLNEALSVLNELDEGWDEVFVIGGHNLFNEALSIADTLYLTVVNGNFIDNNATTHTYFPGLVPFLHRAMKLSNEDNYQVELVPGCHAFMEIDITSMRQSLTSQQ